ncbi:MAG TPA: hypothetical protein VKB19_05160 [Pedobacter sp.]|nr:hypothetical protein [Pedobacter sp.]
MYPNTIVAQFNPAQGMLQPKIKLRGEADGTPFIDKFKSWSYGMLVLCIAWQLIFFWSAANLAAIAYVVLTWGIFCLYFLNAAMLKGYPFSSFIILGYTATQFYFPLLFITLEAKPLVFNLNRPHEVFFHSFMAFLVLLAAHWLYRFLPKQSSRGSGSYLKLAGYFKAPGVMQLWMMGMLGMSANMYVFLFSTTIGTSVTGGALDKAIQAFLPFSYAPYFIPFAALYGADRPLAKKTVSLLITFTIALFIISIIRNSRGAFMVGFTSIGFSYLLGLLLGMFPVPKIALKPVLIAIAGFWFITGPLSDLGTAMVIVRGERNDISKSELIALTLEAYKDKRAIALRRLEDKAFESDWDERYLDNLFTARFSNIKFNDASLEQAAIIGNNNPAMRKFSIDYIWGALPGPLLKLVKPDVDKEMLYATSFGDYIYSLAGGGAAALGGFRSGHFAGSGMAAFGWSYLAILALAIIPVFLLLDKLSYTTKLVSADGKYYKYKLSLSMCGLIGLTSIFQFLPCESVVNPLTFLVRGFVQMVLLYLVIFQVTALAVRLVERFKII